MAFSNPKQLSYLVLGVLFLAGSVDAVPLYYAGNRHYYEFVSGFNTHGQAAAGASAMSHLGVQGHLATITSAGENAFILSLLPQNEIAWIGGERLGNDWTWVETGEGVFWIGDSPGTSVVGAYANWDVAEPNNVNFNEQFIYMRPSGRWADYNSFQNDVNGYIVEYDVPEPGTFALIAAGLGIAGWLRRRNVS